MAGTEGNVASFAHILTKEPYLISTASSEGTSIYGLPCVLNQHQSKISQYEILFTKFDLCMFRYHLLCIAMKIMSIDQGV